MTQIERTLPVVDADTRAFWCGGADGTLKIMRCNDCGFYLHPPGPVCRRCLSQNVHATAVLGTGKVATFTINYQPWKPDMVVPYVFAVIELDDQAGLSVMSNIVNCPVEQVRIEARVHVVFERYGDIWLPLFELDAPK